MREELNFAHIQFKELKEKLNIAQTQFYICDKHRTLAEQIVAEQRLRIKELERENESLRIENDELRTKNESPKS